MRIISDLSFVRGFWQHAESEAVKSHLRAHSDPKWAKAPSVSPKSEANGTADDSWHTSQGATISPAGHPKHSQSELFEATAAASSEQEVLHRLQLHPAVEVRQVRQVQPRSCRVCRVRRRRVRPEPPRPQPPGAWPAAGPVPPTRPGRASTTRRVSFATATPLDSPGRHASPQQRRPCRPDSRPSSVEPRPFGSATVQIAWRHPRRSKADASTKCEELSCLSRNHRRKAGGNAFELHEEGLSGHFGI
mmetsp:Transcript_13047/g.22643  ORF Transcript_13047/g.22643 Transcript_13047/m.22643 type:complete len:247 (-) Transcript_13047:159-899(-)